MLFFLSRLAPHSFNTHSLNMQMMRPSDVLAVSALCARKEGDGQKYVHKVTQWQLDWDLLLDRAAKIVVGSLTERGKHALYQLFVFYALDTLYDDLCELFEMTAHLFDRHHSTVVFEHPTMEMWAFPHLRRRPPFFIHVFYIDEHDNHFHIASVEGSAVEGTTSHDIVVFMRTSYSLPSAMSHLKHCASNNVFDKETAMGLNINKKGISVQGSSNVAIPYQDMLHDAGFNFMAGVVVDDASLKMPDTIFTRHTELLATIMGGDYYGTPSEAAFPRFLILAFGCHMPRCVIATESCVLVPRADYSSLAPIIHGSDDPQAWMRALGVTEVHEYGSDVWIDAVAEKLGSPPSPVNATQPHAVTRKRAQRKKRKSSRLHRLESRRRVLLMTSSLSLWSAHARHTHLRKRVHSRVKQSAVVAWKQRVDEQQRDGMGAVLHAWLREAGRQRRCATRVASAFSALRQRLTRSFVRQQLFQVWKLRVNHVMFARRNHKRAVHIRMTRMWRAWRLQSSRTVLVSSLHRMQACVARRRAVLSHLFGFAVRRIETARKRRAWRVLVAASRFVAAAREKQSRRTAACVLTALKRGCSLKLLRRVWMAWSFIQKPLIDFVYPQSCSFFSHGGLMMPPQPLSREPPVLYLEGTVHETPYRANISLGSDGGPMLFVEVVNAGEGCPCARVWEDFTAALPQFKRKMVRVYGCYSDSMCRSVRCGGCGAMFFTQQ